MPGDRLDDLHLVTFHIEAEVVDSRPIDSEQNRVERETLGPDGSPVVGMHRFVILGSISHLPKSNNNWQSRI